MTLQVPDFLTVEEAARILRIGRTAAYVQANRWLDSGGGDGLPVQRVGGLLRVPRALFEAHYGIPITVIPPTQDRRRPANDRATSPRLAQDIPHPQRTRRRQHGEGDTTQAGLPFAG